jgi:predicted nucleotidyltransferase
MGILEKLFGSHALVKILKLFYLNPESVFPPRDVAKRTHTKPENVRQELRILLDIGFIRPAAHYVAEKPADAHDKPKRKKITGYALDKSFQLLSELRDIVLTVVPLSKQELLARLRRVGRIKLVVLSGIFLKREDSRIDMLIVGDHLKKGQLDWTLRFIESEVGKELAYAILETADFKYRLGMNDKFVRDVFDYPHEVVIDKIGVIR